MKIITWKSMRIRSESFLLLFGVIACLSIYWPGLHGGYLFDDYVNIVNNPSVQVESTDLQTWTNAALSSPASTFKRPLSMLSFAVSYWAGGLDPFWMKLNNLLLHILNGLVLFIVLRLLLELWQETQTREPLGENLNHFAALVSIIWLVTPINTSAVLYVVQRMEILAQTFVLLGLWGYLHGRKLEIAKSKKNGSFLAVGGLVGGSALGMAAKETAILLPAYALAIEVCLLRFANKSGQANKKLIIILSSIVFIPGLLGLIWLLPGIIDGTSFAARDFTVIERLLTESRVLWHYIFWTLLPTPDALSFYHDDIALSQSLFQPLSTLFATLGIFGLLISLVMTWKRLPLYCLGLSFFLISHSLTSTILPLELVFEHRNYFASIGILVAVLSLGLPLLNKIKHPLLITISGAYIFWSSSVTLIRSLEWAHPIKFAYSEAARHPESPRALYELGRALIITSENDPQSPLTSKAKEAFQNASELPRSSILPELALITLTPKGNNELQELWNGVFDKVSRRPPRQEEITATRKLLSCQIHNQCQHWPRETVRLVITLLSHKRHVYLLSDYAYYAAYVLNDLELARRVANDVLEQSKHNQQLKQAMNVILEIESSQRIKSH